MIPKELQEFKGIEKYQVRFFHYVYFLYDKQELVYIGKTAGRLTNRLIEHQIDKNFTDCYILKCSDKETCSTKEGDLIYRFKPKYNKIPLRPSYPKVGAKIDYHTETVKVAAIVNGYVIATSKTRIMPFAIAIEELTKKVVINNP